MRNSKDIVKQGSRRLPTPRVRTEAQRHERRQAILDGAWHLFQSSTYDDITMTQIAEAVRLVKGTIYRCFKSKEELFLTLLEQQLQLWFSEINNWLQDLPAGSSLLQVTALFGQSLEGRQSMLRLLALLHITLDYNIEPESALRYRNQLWHHFTNTGALLEQRLTFLAPGQGKRCVMYCHSIMIGLWQWCDNAPAVQQIMQHTTLQAYNLQFTHELSSLLYAVFAGMEGLWQWQENSGPA